jgi:hypothetical protein
MKAAAKTRTSQPARRQPSAQAGAVKGHASAFREIAGLRSPKSRSTAATISFVSPPVTQMSHRWRDYFNPLTTGETIAKRHVNVSSTSHA